MDGGVGVLTLQVSTGNASVSFVGVAPKRQQEKPLNEVYRVSHTGKFNGVGTLGAYVQTKRAYVKCKWVYNTQGESTLLFMYAEDSAYELPRDVEASPI